jgi:hypothetical protein
MNLCWDGLIPIPAVLALSIQRSAVRIKNITGNSHENKSLDLSTSVVLLLTPWCRVLLEKLVQKFPAFYGTRRFITALTSVRHLSLSWASPVQSTSHLLEIYPNIIQPSTPRSPQWSLSLRFPHQDPIRPPLLTHSRHMPSQSPSSRFYHPHSIGWGVQIIYDMIYI